MYVVIVLLSYYFFLTNLHMYIHVSRCNAGAALIAYQSNTIKHCYRMFSISSEILHRNTKFITRD